MKISRSMLIGAAALVLAANGQSAAHADGPARIRTLSCSDGTTFTGEQVRNGFGLPPHSWRSVEPVPSGETFVFHAASVTLPDGTLVEQFSWDMSAGVDRNHDLVTCSFIIPIGDLAGARADFVGFFVP